MTTSDQGLLDAIVGGEDGAFAELFRRYADSVYNYVFRQTGSWVFAEDAVQKVFLETWRTRETLHLTDGSMRPWLYGVARNLVRREWRDATRRRAALDRLANQQRDVEDGAADSTGRIADEQRLAVVLATLNQLKQGDREILILAAWEQLSLREIAAVLDVPLGTVKSRLARSRHRLGRLEQPVVEPGASVTAMPNRRNIR